MAGASGYLGLHLCRELAKSMEIVALVRRPVTVPGASVVEVASDVGDIDALLENHKPDFVINTVTNYGRGASTAYDVMLANSVFAIGLWMAAHRTGVGCFMNFGTALPAHTNVYAASKQSFVDIVRNYQRSECKFVEFSLEHFYGEFDSVEKFTGMLFDGLVKNKPILLTEGTQSRDFIYVSDIVTAVSVVMARVCELESFQEYGLGSGSLISVREFVIKAKKIFSSRSDLKFGAIAARSGEFDGHAADISALKELGWEPVYKHDEALGMISNLMAGR